MLLMSLLLSPVGRKDPLSRFTVDSPGNSSSFFHPPTYLSVHLSPSLPFSLSIHLFVCRSIPDLASLSSCSSSPLSPCRHQHRSAVPAQTSPSRSMTLLLALPRATSSSRVPSSPADSTESDAPTSLFYFPPLSLAISSPDSH